MLQVMDDLRAADVDFLTIGQYLQPTRKHAEVKRFVTPDEFKALRDDGAGQGLPAGLGEPADALVLSCGRGLRAAEGGAACGAALISASCTGCWSSASRAPARARSRARWQRETGLPLIHLDTEFWRPGWKITPREEWRAKVAELVAREAWIMDGSFGASLDLRLPRADTVMWFDYPAARVPAPGCLAGRSPPTGRFVKTWRRGVRRRFDLEFLRYIWDFNAKSRPQIVTMLERHGRHLQPVVFRRDRDVARYPGRPAGN